MIHGSHNDEKKYQILCSNLNRSEKLGNDKENRKSRDLNDEKNSSCQNTEAYNIINLTQIKKTPNLHIRNSFAAAKIEKFDILTLLCKCPVSKYNCIFQKLYLFCHQQTKYLKDKHVCTSICKKHNTTLLKNIIIIIIIIS